MYQLLVLLHVGGVVIFVGTIVSALVWQRAAERSQDRPIIAHTYHVLNRFDSLITPAAVVTIAVTGVLLAKLASLPMLRTGWIFWSLVAWGASGALFATALFPLQRRLEHEANSDAMRAKSKKTYMRMSKRWARLTHLTLVGILISFSLMVLKPIVPTPSLGIVSEKPPCRQ